MKKKILVLTGGGDCPGLNAVLRAIVKTAETDGEFEVLGSISSFDGVLNDPQEIIPLDESRVSGIHVKGGTILRTTTKGGPFSWPVQNADGSWSSVDRSDELLEILEEMGVHAIISIGGDGSQRISHALYKKGCNIIGVPKTIDNDLSATDMTFGFRTAVQIATESVDKLVTTAESHNRVMIMEVMGREAGWIALEAALAGGAEICLIPEIPYKVENVLKAINERYENGVGFVNIVIAEGAKPLGGEVTARKSDEIGYENVRLGGVAYRLMQDLKDAGMTQDTRVTVLGHVQRGGIPIAFDRILATQFGVKAFEMVKAGEFGRMVAYKGHQITSTTLKSATEKYNYVGKDSYVLHSARMIGINFGD